MRIYKTPILLKKIFPSFIWHISTQEKKLYLTFDDGPIPDVTEFVLECLDNYEAKGSFFCVGNNIEKYPAIFEKIVEAKHLAANHTFNHLNGWKTENNVYVDNTCECQKWIEKFISFQKIKFFRPPYGRIKSKQAQMLRSNFKIIMWDVLTNDYDQSLNKEKCLKNSIAATEKGSIIVFHDSIKSYKNMSYTLPRYLDHFSEKGFQFETL